MIAEVYSRKPLKVGIYYLSLLTGTQHTCGVYDVAQNILEVGKGKSSKLHAMLKALNQCRDIEKMEQKPIEVRYW